MTSLLAAEAVAASPRGAFAAKKADSVKLLENLKLDHGPIEDIAAFLLIAEKAMSDLGITVFISPISELARVCDANPNTWGWFSPILDVRIAPLDATNSYSITGCDRTGQVVVLQGGRLFDTGEKSLQQIADDQSIYYGVARNPTDDELRCQLPAPMASTLKGRLHYSGGLWVNPSYRGRGFPAIMERISRALALGWWGTNHTFSFISDSLAGSPVFSAYGYKNIQPSYSIFKGTAELYKGSLIWMDSESLAADLKEFTSNGFAKVDRAVVDRRGKNAAAS